MPAAILAHRIELRPQLLQAYAAHIEGIAQRAGFGPCLSHADQVRNDGPPDIQRRGIPNARKGAACGFDLGVAMACTTLCFLQSARRTPGPGLACGCAASLIGLRTRTSSRPCHPRSCPGWNRSEEERGRQSLSPRCVDRGRGFPDRERRGSRGGDPPGLGSPSQPGFPL